MSREARKVTTCVIINCNKMIPSPMRYRTIFFLESMLVSSSMSNSLLHEVMLPEASVSAQIKLLGGNEDSGSFGLHQVPLIAVKVEKHHHPTVRLLAGFLSEADAV